MEANGFHLCKGCRLTRTIPTVVAIAFLAVAGVSWREGYLGAIVARVDALPVGVRSIASNPVPPPSAPAPSAFAAGLAARTEIEQWFAAQSGDFKAGAEFWASQRSLRKPGGCRKLDGATRGAFVNGCQAARVKFSELDKRRKADAAFRAGWNSYGQQALPNSPNSKDEAALPPQFEQTTTSIKVMADKKADRLAYDASKGDAAALAELRAGVAASDPASMYGLAKYDVDIAPSPQKGLDLELIEDYDNKIDTDTSAEHQHVKSLYMHHNELLQSAIELLTKAANLGDPGAQGALGMEYVVEGWRSIAMLDFVDHDLATNPNHVPEAQDQKSVQLARWACDNGKLWLDRSMKQGWPNAFANMALIYGDGAIKVPAYMSLQSGCQIYDPPHGKILMQKAAELGDAEAQWVIREDAYRENRTSDAAIWEIRLKQLSDGGDREARELIPLQARSNSQ